MSATGPGHDWDGAYAEGAPPWDIGRPQPAVHHLAEEGALTGTVLDAGCGTGEHTILAARYGARALGVDISSRAIEIARSKAAERGVEVTFRRGDMLALDASGLDSLGDGVETFDPFDAVIDIGLFHVFDDAARGRYVRSVHSVLRPGGHLHLMCFSDRQPGDWGPRRVTEVELRAAFGSGWLIDSIAPDRFDINPGIGTAHAEAWRADLIRVE